MRRVLRVLSGLFLLSAFALLVAAAAVGQEVDHNMRGQHPHQMGVADPYAKARSVKGNDCCHGTDCTRFYGTPVRAEKDGAKGWQFGKWFVRDDQLIDVETIADKRELAFHHLCLNSTETTVYCGHIAANG
jgi:hypothetical protein